MKRILGVYAWRDEMIVRGKIKLKNKFIEVKKKKKKKKKSIFDWFITFFLKKLNRTRLIDVLRDYTNFTCVSFLPRSHWCRTISTSNHIPHLFFSILIFLRVFFCYNLFLIK